MVREYGLNSHGSGQRHVEDSCDDGNKRLDYIKGAKFLSCISKYQLIFFMEYEEIY
jgi:hypothetical protein